MKLFKADYGQIKALLKKDFLVRIRQPVNNSIKIKKKFLNNQKILLITVDDINSVYLAMSYIPFFIYSKKPISSS